MTPAFLIFLAALATRTAIVLLVLVVGLRMLGKREIGQMNIYDLALILALGNAVQNAMTHGSGTLAAGFVTSAALFGTGALFAALFRRRPDWEKRIVGAPTLLVQDGEILRANCRRERVTDEELMTALREHGLTDVEQVALAVLEVDGSISVMRAKDLPAKSTAGE